MPSAIVFSVSSHLMNQTSRIMFATVEGPKTLFRGSLVL